MAKKKTFSATKAVKAMSRKAVGTVKSSRVIDEDEKPPRKEKHKKTFAELLDEGE